MYNYKLFVLRIVVWSYICLLDYVDYADDLVIHTNMTTLAKSLEQEAEGIGTSVNANKTESICFKQEGVIFFWSGKPLKVYIPW